MNIQKFNIQNAAACFGLEGMLPPLSVRTAVKTAIDMDDLIAKLAISIGENKDKTAQNFIREQISYFNNAYSSIDSHHVNHMGMPMQ